MNVKNWIAGFVALVMASVAYEANAVTVTDSGDICLNCAVGSVTNFTDDNLTSAFAQAWEFSLNTEANVGFALENENDFGQFIDGLQLFVMETPSPVGDDYPTDLGSWTVIGSTAVVGDGLTENLFLAALGVGTYWALVVGTPDTTGAYTGTMSVSAVPLPAAVWLFISALVGLVSFARIRRNGTPA